MDDRIVAELERLRDDDARRRLLDEFRPHSYRGELVERLSREVFQRVRVDGNAALALAHAAVLVARELDDPRWLATSLRSLGTAQYAVEEYRAAVLSYDEATELFEQKEDLLGTARTLSTSTQALILLGRYDRAHAAAEKARAIFERLGDSRRLSRLKINIGNIHHRQDRFEEALGLYEEAYRGLVGDGDPAAVEGVAAALSNISGCLIMMNDFPRALTFYREAREVCERHGMSRLVAQADYNIAYMYYLRGEYSRSIDMLNAARQLFQRTADPYHCALCDMDQAEIYLDLNLFEEAARLALRAHERFRELGTGYEQAKSRALEAISVANAGNCYRALDLFSEARESFLREKNRTWPSLIDLYRALVLAGEGRVFEAHRLARRALPVFDEARLSSKAAVTRLLLSRLALRIGDVPEAERHVARALAQAEGVDSPLLAYQALVSRGEVEEAAGEILPAVASYERSIAILETLRSSLQREEMKIAFMRNRLGGYEALVDLLLRRDDPSEGERTFGFIERAKARGLVDLILGSIRGRSDLGGGESELARRVQDLRQELNWYHRRIEHEQLAREGFDPGRLEDLSRTAKTRENELLDALREMPAHDEPLAAGLKQNEPVSLSRIQSALGAERALLELYVARGRLYGCVITDESLQIRPIAVADQVRDLVQRLQFQLSRFQLPPEHVKTFRAAIEEATLVHLAELYDCLIAPVAPLFAGRDLVIVPHGFTHYVPFHALTDGKRFLIDDYTVSYAPSASVYVHCREQPDAGGDRSLILGVPDESTPFILEEVRSVAASVANPEVLLGESARLESLREKAPGSRVLHVASHGYHRRDNPMFSAIRLSDFHLSLYDLYELRLPVELATMSACSTGLSVVVEGDELVGLVRGLLYAGARSTVVALWNVPDRATASLMQTFYHHLGTGMERAAALRCAMLEQREKTPQPFYWAPYVLVGRTGPV